jgi:hypothetical protein
MKKSKIALKLRVNAETVLHLRSIHDVELLRVRGGVAVQMTTYDPDCETSDCYRRPRALGI